MFCDKTNVNILTSILLQSGITDAVVCPGSRNGVIVHNLHELTRTASPEHPFRIHAVTDERSAAFVALGISLAQDLRPVAVCVTSGSALLNTIPAVAEAFYRQIPLLLNDNLRGPVLFAFLVLPAAHLQTPNHAHQLPLPEIFLRKFAALAKCNTWNEVRLRLVLSLETSVDRQRISRYG